MQNHPENRNMPIILSDIEFLQQFFGDKCDKSQVPCWRHGQMVAETLVKFLEQNGETPQNIETLRKIGLGHDLIEDTEVTEEEVLEQWGADVLEGIKQLTNYQGDSDFSLYLKNLQSAPSEVTLIKLADIHSNLFNSIRCFEVLGIDWTTSFWLPLLHKYERLYSQIEVTDYPKTAQEMFAEIENGIRELENLVLADTTN